MWLTQFEVYLLVCVSCFFFQAEDGIRDLTVTGVQTCALPISLGRRRETVDAAEARGVLLSKPSALREAGFANHHFCGPEDGVYELARTAATALGRSEEHTSELQSQSNLVCRLLPEKKKK